MRQKIKQIRYAAEQKRWAIEQMKTPLNRTVAQVAKDTGITQVSLRSWRNAARHAGECVPAGQSQHPLHGRHALALVALLARVDRRHRVLRVAAARRSAPHEVLKRRLANGDISAEEYEQRKALLDCDTPLQNSGRRQIDIDIHMVLRSILKTIDWRQSFRLSRKEPTTCTAPNTITLETHKVCPRGIRKATCRVRTGACSAKAAQGIGPSRLHWSHVADNWIYLLLVCPLTHLFHGYGGHGGHTSPSSAPTNAKE